LSARVFVSYRHVKPDEALARVLVDEFARAGLRVFVDRQIRTGTRWAQEIDQQIRATRFFVVLISAESMRSDMVRREVQLAAQLADNPKHGLRILPVWVSFSGTLPYDLAAWLDPYQRYEYRRGQAYRDVARDLIAAMEDRLPPSAAEVPELVEPASPDHSAVDGSIPGPLPVADISLETGALPPDSRFYIERLVDPRVLASVAASGSTTVVKGARQMGKSSLLARSLQATLAAGQRACFIDFQLLDESAMVDLNALCLYLARRLQRDLQVDAEPSRSWDARLGPKESLTSYIEDTLFAPGDERVVLFLDEVDRVFDFSYRSDFFALVRAWHNRRSTNPRWRQLNLVIAHSTEPYLWIERQSQSPFNVGNRYELEDFNDGQVATLNARHGTPLPTEQALRRLITLLSGHPYLVRQALYLLVTGEADLAQLEHDGPTDRGPFGDHLRQLVWGLRDQTAVRKSLKQILQKQRCDNEEHFLRLRAAGIVTGAHRNAVQPRCQLYAAYLRDHL
jgi:hypothetical protein